MLAKDIVRATNQIKKLEQFCGQLNAVSMRISSCSTLNELGDAMNNAAKAMTLVSNKLDTKKLQAMAKVLAKEDMKLEMKSDMMSDVLDSLGEGMDNEEEQEELYNKVLVEAGVIIEGEMVRAGKDSLQAEKIGQQKQLAGVGGDAGDDDDLDAMLRAL